MPLDAFLRLLEEALEREPHSLAGSEALEEIEWGSLSVITFLAVVDEQLNIQLNAKQVNECRTLPQLLELLGSDLQR